MTNIAKITNVTKFQTQKKKKSRRAPKCPLKYRKSNKDFACVLKTPVTNIARIAKITNVTKFQTQKAKKQRRAPKCPQISQKS